MSLNFYCREEENSREESINRYKNIFINYEKTTPSLSEALNQMFKSEDLGKKKINELTEDIIAKCKAKIDTDFDSIKKKYENLTKEDAYIICSYTCESIDRAYSPYKILNQNLVANNRQKGVNNISKYLYIFLKSLRKLPRYYPENKVLYRCLTCHVNLSEDDKNNDTVPYKIGNKKTFWGFTSTSKDPKMTYSFLKDKETMKTGTIFSLGGDVWGYDIEPFNFYREKEILLEPERKFIISNVLPPINDIINITCNILETNLILSDNKLESNLNSKYTKENENSKMAEYLIKFDMETKINDEIKFTEGIGILCNIPSKNIKALITYNHMLNFDFLNKGEKMMLYINKKEKEINIKNKRYKYTNEDLDITIIEILDIDNIINFIEIDKYINSRNYVDSDIISVSLKKDDQLELLDCVIIRKNNDNYESNIESVKNGIIVLKNNLKLIGIIKEKEEKTMIIPMNIIINKINFIKCVYEIKKDDIGKEIQIINNKDDDDKIKNEEIQKKVKIIINGEIESNILKYKLNKEGDYIIYLISYNDLTDISYMFYNCSSLKELNLSSFNTNQVTDMSGMFYYCSSLKELNLSAFNTNQVSNMSRMFSNCSSLKELNLSSLNTNQVTNMNCMFYYCSSLKELNLSTFNTNQVTDMSSMFCNCSSLKELNLSTFNTNQVTNMNHMFSNCSSLKELNLSSFDTSQVTNMNCMFWYCSSLKELNLSSFNTNQVTNMSEMFCDCFSLKELNLSSFNINQVTDMSWMFKSCSSLKELNLSSFTTNQVTNVFRMFESINKKCKIKCEDKQILQEFKNSTGCIII